MTRSHDADAGHRHPGRTRRRAPRRRAGRGAARSPSPTPTARSGGRKRCRSPASRRSARRCTGSCARCPPRDFAPRERATIAEVLRDQVAHLHTELARRYAGKAQPAVDRELEAAEQAIALWQGLWEQYSACLKPLLEGDPELQGVKAKLLQRGLYVGKQLVLVARARAPRAAAGAVAGAARVLPARRDARLRGHRGLRRPACRNAVGISCYSTYSHALLLGLADPCAMSVKQIELTDRWLGHVGAQGLSVRAAARDRRPGDPGRPRRRRPARRSRPRAPRAVRRRRCASAIRASSRPACAGA